MTMVTATEIESWRRCRRKREYTSLNTKAYTPIWPNMKTLGLGSLVHQAGEMWLQEDNPTATPNMFSNLFHEAASRLFKSLVEVCEKTNYHYSDRQEDEFWEAITLGRHMCQNYQDYWHSPLPDGYVLVKPEQQCVVPIPGTEHCKCTKHGLERVQCCEATEDSWIDKCLASGCLEYHYLESTLDAILADDQGRLFVYERKTFGQHPTIHHLNRTFQFVVYSWTLTQVVKHWGTSNEVAGVLYDGLWKRSTPPATGKWKNNQDSLFLRHYLIHNQDKLDEIEREIAHDVAEMSDPNRFISHTVPAVKGCIDCDIVDVCDRLSNGEDTTLLLRTNYTRRTLTPAFQEFYATMDTLSSD